MTLILLGGFLASGKTTALVRVALYYLTLGKRVAVITNDQAGDIVDSDIFRASGLEAAEVSGGCFCCRLDDFLARADELIEQVQPDVILAEPVGSCTDLVASVIEPLARRRSDLRTAPFVVLLDPTRALQVLEGRSPLSESITYIYGTQQQEADCLAVSKIDLLDSDERARLDGMLAARFPGVERIAFSARTGEGIERLIEVLERDTPRARARRVDVDYAIYAEGEGQLGWLNASIQLSAAKAFELDEALTDLARRVNGGCAAAGFEIGHAKLFARSEGGAAVVSIAGSGSAPDLSFASRSVVSSLDLIVNLRVACEPRALHGVWQQCLQPWVEQWDLEIQSGSGQCFRPAAPKR